MKFYLSERTEPGRRNERARADRRVMREAGSKFAKLNKYGGCEVVVHGNRCNDIRSEMDKNFLSALNGTFAGTTWVRAYVPGGISAGG